MSTDPAKIAAERARAKAIYEARKWHEQEKEARQEFLRVDAERPQFLATIKRLRGLK